MQNVLQNVVYSPHLNLISLWFFWFFANDLTDFFISPLYVRFGTTLGLVLAGPAISILINVVFYHLYGGVATLFDRFPFWLWTQFKFPSYQEETQHWQDLIWNVLFNQLVVMSLFALVLYGLATAFGFQIAPMHPIPTFSKMLIHSLIYTLLFELFAYTGHRIQHMIPRLFRSFHALHHSTHASLGISADFMHPVDYILEGAIPTFVPLLIVNPHVVTMWYLVSITAILSVHGHGAYKFPLLPSPIDHLRHHQYPTVNFGIGLLDFLCRTDYDTFQSQLDKQNDKHKKIAN